MSTYLTIRPFHAVKWQSHQKITGVTANVRELLKCSENQSLYNQLTRKRAYSGEMTRHSQKRMKRCVENLFAISKPKEVHRPCSTLPLRFIINFITLTLPYEQYPNSDKDIHTKIFLPWLEYCKQKKGIRSYVWKCERQKNGNIHYHLLTDVYFDKNSLTTTWNYHCERLQLVSKFKAKHGHSNPPSTQVKAAQNASEVQNYIRKYIGKSISDSSMQLRIDDDASRLQGIKCWDASANLKQKHSAVVNLKSDELATLNYTEWLTPKSIYKSEHYTIYKLNQLTRHFIFNQHATQTYETWKQTIQHTKEPIFNPPELIQTANLAREINSNPSIAILQKSNFKTASKKRKVANTKIHPSLFAPDKWF